MLQPGLLYNTIIIIIIIIIIYNVNVGTILLSIYVQVYYTSRSNYIIYNVCYNLYFMYLKR